MVTERADTPDGGDAPANDPQDVGIVDLTPTNQGDVSDVVDAAPVTTEAEGQAPVAEAPPIQEAAPVVPETPVEESQIPGQPTFAEIQEQMKHQQEQLQYFQQMQQQQQLQQQATTYAQELERQGYLPEQAQMLAQDRMKNSQENILAQQRAQELQQHREGQLNAADHFATKYNLAISDLATLRKMNTPEEMESEAKRISETRELRAEVARLKQGQVPAQSFDDNQPSPAASGSEDDLLDKYIAGDRSPQAVAAAARLLG